MRVMVVGLGLGAPLIALAYAVRSDDLGRVGAVVELVGTIGLVAYVVGAWQVRGRWISDLAWRAMAIGSLSAGVGWFGLASAVAAGRVLLLGVTPDAWSLALMGAPLAAGWITQSVIGAWTHLLPAISPGSPQRHAGQRRILGTAAAPRITALNGGVALLAIGLAWSAPACTAAGAAIVAAALLIALLLLMAATVAQEPRR